MSRCRHLDPVSPYRRLGQVIDVESRCGGPARRGHVGHLRTLLRLERWRQALDRLTSRISTQAYAGIGRLEFGPCCWLAPHRHSGRHGLFRPALDCDLLLWDIQQLMDALAQNRSSQASFVEKKTIAMLERPVIEKVRTSWAWIRSRHQRAGRARRGTTEAT